MHLVSLSLMKNNYSQNAFKGLYPTILKSNRVVSLRINDFSRAISELSFFAFSFSISANVSTKHVKILAWITCPCHYIILLCAEYAWYKTSKDFGWASNKMTEDRNDLLSSQMNIKNNVFGRPLNTMLVA